MGAMQPPDAKAANLGMLGRPLLLVGASVRAAAESAKRAGFRVTGIDLFGDVDTRAACDHYFRLDQKAVSAIAAIHPAGEANLLVVGGLDGTTGIVSELASRYSRLGPGDALCKQIGSIGFLKQVADESDVWLPESVDDGENASLAGRWLSKDPASSGGLSVCWKPRPNVRNRVFFQRWVPGRLFGATCLGDGASAQLLGVCAARFTRIGLCPFVYAGSFGPVSLPANVWDQVVGLTESIVQHSGLNGLFNVDFIVFQDSVHILEVNPRWSASMEVIEKSMVRSGQLGQYRSLIEAAYGSSVPDLGIEACVDIHPEHQTLKRVVFSRRSGQFDVRRLESLNAANAVFVDLPADGQRIERQAPILTVLVPFGREQPVRWQELRRLIAHVQSAVVSPECGT